MREGRGKAPVGLTRASGRALGLLAALMLVAAGCDSPSVPGRRTAYAFTTESGAPRVLRWRSGRTIGVYAVPSGDGASALGTALEAAVAAWNPLALYGEYRLEPVTSAAQADVLVVWSDATPPVDEAGCPAHLAGYGVTTFCVTGDGAHLVLFPLVSGGGGRTKMVVTLLAAMRGDAAQTRRILAHELGHALGLLRHSPNPADLMYVAPVVDAPSAADEASVELLYHTQPDITP